MAERSIKASEFFSFVERKKGLKGKKGSTCRVSFCRNPRAPGRSICYKCNMQLWRARNPMRACYNNVKGKSKQRRIKFAITFDEFRSICEATGYLEDKGRTPDSLTLDRVDPDRGYEFDNIKVITMSENASKGSYERWVTTKDGRRVRLYQIGVQKDEEVIDQAEEEAEEDSLPDWLNTRQNCLLPLPTPSDNEPF